MTNEERGTALMAASIIAAGQLAAVEAEQTGTVEPAKVAESVANIALAIYQASTKRLGAFVK